MARASVLLLLSLAVAHALRLAPSAPPRAVRAAAPRMLDAPIKEKIDGLIEANPVMVFMKGNKLFPQCGFSNTVGRLRGRFEL